MIVGKSYNRSSRREFELVEHSKQASALFSEPQTLSSDVGCTTAYY